MDTPQLLDQYGRTFSQVETKAPEEFFAGILPAAQSVPPPRGTFGLLGVKATNPWIYAIADKVSTSVASTTWKVFVVERRGRVQRASALQRADYLTRQKMLHAERKQGNLRELESHPLLDMLTAGNEMHSGFIVLQLMQQYLDLSDEAYWLKERNPAGMPIALWPVPPTWISRPANPAVPFYEIDYRGLHEMVPATEVVRFFRPDLRNPYERGIGRVRSMADEIEIAEYSAKYMKQTFFNQARPDLIISGKDITKESTGRLEQKWTEKLQGFWNVAKPFFLSGEVNIAPIPTNLEHLKITEMRKDERDQILQIWGLPPEQFGILSSSNRATIAGSDYIYDRRVILPRLEFARTVLQHELVPDFDDRIILDFVSPVEDDKEFILNAMKAAPYAFEIDEWRALANQEDLPPEKGGKRFVMPFNLVTVEGFNVSEPPLPSPEPLPPAAPSTEEPEQRGFPGRHTKIDITDIDAIAGVLNADDLSLHATLGPVLSETVQHFGERMAAELNTIFEFRNPRVLDYLERQSLQRIQRLEDETTKQAIRSALREGVSEGEGTRDLAKRVQAVFSDASKVRARAIAKTETTNASGYAAVEGMRQAAVEVKEWLSTRDDRTRDTHLSMDGQQQRLDDDFHSPSGDHGPYPGAFQTAAETVFCRCVNIAVISESEGRSYLDTEEKRVAAWKVVEAERGPFDTQMERAAKRGFRMQEKAVLEALRLIAGENIEQQ